MLDARPSEGTREKMVEVKWSPQAVEDLEGILDYIGKDSPLFAARFAEQILHAVESLQHDPERGRMVPEKDDSSMREIFLKRYRIIYRIQEYFVEVITIIHGSRNSLNL